MEMPTSVRGRRKVDKTRGMIEETVQSFSTKKHPSSPKDTLFKLHLYTHLARLVRLELDLSETNVSYVESKDVV